MPRTFGISRLIPELLRTILTRRVTVRFPFAPLTLPPAYRGNVTIDPTACRGCGLCVRDCPADGLELEVLDGGGVRLVHHQDRCAYCGQCAESCRQNAIELTNELVEATPKRRTLRQVFSSQEPEPPSQPDAGRAGSEEEKEKEEEEEEEEEEPTA
jgi:formate hydrogenlyase subunit 6/NADH:ubiquinone oxidoreductase subunit I